MMTQTGVLALLGRLIVCHVLLLACSTGSAAGQNDPAKEVPVVAETGKPELEAGALSALTTRCVIISDSGLFTSVFGDRFSSKDAPAVLRTGTRACPGVAQGSGVLNGSGDLAIAVDQAAFERFRAAKRDQQGQFVLYLNGVALPTDAHPLATETVGSLAVLRYRINQGKESQVLWSILYADGHLFTPGNLYAALGWKADSETTPSFIPVRSPPGSPQTAQVQITTGPQLAIALALVVLSFGVVIYIGVSGDALRDTGLPAWWSEAAALKAAVGGMTDNALASYLGTQYPWYPKLGAAACIERAEQVLQRQPLAAEHVPAATVGLALTKLNWKPLRATYSLSRTQLALWFTFAVAAGLFLWVLYGDLRRIDGSLLSLLGISIGTAGASWLVDRNMEDRPYSPSRGFFADLLTGFDEQRQLHRYQAFVVNVLLLAVGIFHVERQLSYPVFDATWLIFLGVSGSAYGIGKSVIETKPKT